MTDQRPSPSQPHGDNRAPNAPSSQPPPLTAFAQSERNAYAKVNLCRRFKAMALYYLETSQHHNSSEGDNPSAEARENAKGLKVQWQQHILANEGATDLDVVLRASFLHEAQEEVRRLECFIDSATAQEVRLAWVGWKEVVKLVGECGWWKEDVDREMAKFR